jgi:hypothetical protein
VLQSVCVCLQHLLLLVLIACVWQLILFSLLDVFHFMMLLYVSSAMLNLSESGSLFVAGGELGIVLNLLLSVFLSVIAYVRSLFRLVNLVLLLYVVASLPYEEGWILSCLCDAEPPSCWSPVYGS